jgi:hypothetical protein
MSAAEDRGGVRSHPAIATRKEAVMPRLRPTLALIAALCALAATPAVAPAQQDLRSPDSREAALAQDRDGLFNSIPEGQDERSPDARDAAAGRLPGGPGVVVVPAPSPVTASSREFDWRAAAIGAGVAVGLILLATSVVLLVRRRRTVQVA